MLRLKPPPWTTDNNTSRSSLPVVKSTSTTTSTATTAVGEISGPSTSPSPSPSASSTVSPSPLFEELVTSLNNRRSYREVVLSLSSGLQDATADFSFLRLKGLKALLNLLTTVSKSEALIGHFKESQTDRRLQVVPALFEHSLAPAKNSCTVQNMPSNCEDSQQVVSPPTDREVTLALRVLEGCCLIDKRSRIIAARHMAIKEVIELLSAGGILEQSACLDALPALMLDTPINQKEFLAHQGIKKVSDLVKHGHVDETMRLKCAEFLLLLVGIFLPDNNNVDIQIKTSAEYELQGQLGDAFVSVLKESGNLVASKEIPQEREETLYSQAKHLLDVLDSINW